MNLPDSFYRYQRLKGMLPSFLHRHRLLNLALQFIPGDKQVVAYNQDASLVADLRESDPANYFLKGAYDLDFIDVASFFLSHGGVYFDVGANYGFNTFGILGRIAGPRIECHLFEMHPRPVACLRESVKLHPDFPVTVNHVAVTNRVGTVQFLPHPEHTTRSRIASTDGAVDIEAVTLDHYLQKQGIQRVDFLKMDIEGWEPVAFQGATESLKNGSLPVIFVELSTVPLAEQGFTAEDLVRPLREAGYRLYFVRPGDLENRAVEILEFHGKGIKVAPVDELPTEGSTDLLAVRPDLRA